MGFGDRKMVGSRSLVLGNKMINLPRLTDAVSNKKVIVRLDLDMPDGDFSRLESALSTLKFLKEKNCKIVVIGHKGRPEGKVDPSLSILPFKQKIKDLLGGYEIEVLENLRFNPGEEKNDPQFAKELASHGEFFVNEAFAVSHREHASIVGLPKLLPHAAGIRFAEEVENLSKILDNPTKPLLMIISGVKDDKLKYINNFLKFADKILVGGRLPDYIHDTSPLRKNPKVLVAGLIADKEDISIHSIEQFEREIAPAGTVVISGPLGKFEEEGHRAGTKRVLEAVTNSGGFKVAGGGDTEAAINLLGLKDKFDWISVGGGAMLEFLATSALPGITALV
jgi:phosphoglycerate kinase